MKLLFITQKVDKDDDVLGVYHEWISRLAGRYAKLSVICLYRGRAELPDNVSVYSLGKEKYNATPTTRMHPNHPNNSGHSGKFGYFGSDKKTVIKRIKYIFRFYRYIWQLRREYDKVFVHMNKEYVILGWKLWKLLGKKIFFWHNHPMGDWLARLAIFFADKVFYTSPFAFAARYKKSFKMPVGIDTERFRNLQSLRSVEQSHKNSILYLGRISPIKHIETLIDAASILDERGIDFKITVAGDPGRESDKGYADSLRKSTKSLVKKGKILFVGAVPNDQAAQLYNSHAISVNLTPTGSFDKTIIEAMACESLVVASNKAVSDILPTSLQFQEGNPVDLARALETALKFGEEDRKKIGAGFRKYVLENHDLNLLVKKLVGVLN